MTDSPLFQSPDSTPQASSEANRALEQEARLPLTGWQQEVTQGLEYGLEAAASIRDRSIPTFSRGELPHYAGINTFLKAPYLEDVRRVGEYDVAIVGFPMTLVQLTVLVHALVPREFVASRLFTPPTTLSWVWTCGSKLPCAMSEIFSRFLLTTKNPSTRFLKALPTSSHPVRFPFC